MQENFEIFAKIGRFAKISCREKVVLCITIGKLWTPTIQKFAKFSRHDPPDAANLRNFPVLQYNLKGLSIWLMDISLQYEWHGISKLYVIRLIKFMKINSLMYLAGTFYKAYKHVVVLSCSNIVHLGNLGLWCGKLFYFYQP